MKRIGLFLLAIVLVAGMIGCTPTSPTLTSGDRSMCAMAGEGNDWGIFLAAGTATDQVIIEQAARIFFGSSDANVNDAMNKIVKRCEELGYRY